MANDGKRQRPDKPQELDDDAVEQVAGGAGSTGAGAGRVTFNPFSITRKVDRSTP